MLKRPWPVQGTTFPRWNGGNSGEEGEYEGEESKYRIAQNGCEETE